MPRGVHVPLFVKVLCGVLLLFIIYELNRTFSLYYPDHLFEYESPYRNAVLYAGEPINRNHYEIVEQVYERMAEVSINDPDLSFYIYFIESPSLFASFAEKLDLNSAAQGLTITPLGYILVNLSAINQTRTLYGDRYPHTLFQGDPVQIISHEFVHVLMSKHLGFLRYRSLDTWKQEGYAEYAATLRSKRSDSLYSFPERMVSFMEGYYDELSERQQFYIRSELLVEYLTDVEQMGFDEIMQLEDDMSVLFQRVVEWEANQ